MNEQRSERVHDERLDIHPVTPDRWADLEDLFGPNGAYSGCWCMWFRQTSGEYEAARGEPNRRSLQQLVDAGREPGLLLYRDFKPAGWVSVAPRGQFGRILRSPLFGRGGEDEHVWAVVCFFVPRHQRGRGVARDLLAGAVRHARTRGASVVEGYPIEPEGRPAADLYHGTPALFSAAGFTEIARPNEHRVLMRLELQERP